MIILGQFFQAIYFGGTIGKGHFDGVGIGRNSVAQSAGLPHRQVGFFAVCSALTFWVFPATLGAAPKRCRHGLADRRGAGLFLGAFLAQMQQVFVVVFAMLGRKTPDFHNLFVERGILPYSAFYTFHPIHPRLVIVQNRCTWRVAGWSWRYCSRASGEGPPSNK